MTGRVIFWSGAFVQADVLFSAANRQAVKDLLIERYGEPNMRPENFIRWRGNAVSVDFAETQHPEAAELVGHLATILYEDLLERALQRWKLRTQAALKIFSINFNRYDLEIAKQKADREYERDKRDAESKLQAYRSAQCGSFRISLNEYL